MAFRLASARGLFLQFGRARAGAIAVEFALAAGPLLAVMLFIVDMTANYIIFQQIDATGRTLAAQLRAGSIDAKTYSAQTFRDQIVCPALPTLTCANVVVTLAGLSRLVTLSSTDMSAPRWCPGGAGDVLVFQLAYPVPFLTRIWAGGYAEKNPHYVVSFGLRNGPDAMAGIC